jgi:multidrug resistance efflux pump
MLLHQLERRLKLTVGLAVTQEELDNVRHQSDSAASSYQKSTASRELAALNHEQSELHRSAIYMNAFESNSRERCVLNHNN